MPASGSGRVDQTQYGGSDHDIELELGVGVVGVRWWPHYGDTAGGAGRGGHRQRASSKLEMEGRDTW
jgi:hypothetical protein